MDADEVDGHMQNQMEEEDTDVERGQAMILTSQMKKKMQRRSRILHGGIMTFHLQ